VLGSTIPVQVEIIIVSDYSSLVSFSRRVSLFTPGIALSMPVTDVAFPNYVYL
jgi:hypothetical protein